MKLDDPIGLHEPNDRAVIGGNRPPETPLEEHDRKTSELLAAASSWINEIQTIESQAQADAAAKLLKDCRAAEKAAEEARKEQSTPLHDAWKKCLADWKVIESRPGKAKTAIDALLRPWLKKLDDEKKAAIAKAQAEAEAAARAAEEAAEAAVQAVEAAQAGGKAGTGENTLAAMEAAEAAHVAALKAQENVERTAFRKVGAGGNFPDANGLKRSVGLRKRTVLISSLPTNAPRRVREIALVKMLNGIFDGLSDERFAALEEGVLRYANEAFRAAGVVPAGCTTREIESVQ